MSANDQDLGATKRDEKKYMSLQQTDTLAESKGVSHSVPTDIGGGGDIDSDRGQDNNDLTVKALESKKLSEFDDVDDDFNSDELQLRWDDDDEPNIDETSVKELESQDNKDSKDEKVSKETEANTSKSLVTAVEELEQAIIETNDQVEKLICSDKAGINDHDDSIENGEGKSAKEILENIDKFIRSDENVGNVDKINDFCDINPNETEQTALHADVTEVNTKNCKSFSESKVDPVINLNESEMDVDNSDIRDAIHTDSLTKIDKTVETVNINDISTDIVDSTNILSSTANESMFEDDVKFEHGLKQPDMILEIPTQEIIDCLDDYEDSDCENRDNEKSLGTDKGSKTFDTEIESSEKEVTETVSEFTANDKISESEIMELKTEVIEVPKKEFSENDVEMSDVAEKCDVALLATEPIKENLKIDPQISDKDNDYAPVEMASIDEPKITSVDTAMDAAKSVVNTYNLNNKSSTSIESEVDKQKIESESLSPKATDQPLDKIEEIAKKTTVKEVVTSEDKTKETLEFTQLNSTQAKSDIKVVEGIDENATSTFNNSNKTKNEKPLDEINTLTSNETASDVNFTSSNAQSILDSKEKESPVNIEPMLDKNNDKVGKESSAIIEPTLDQNKETEGSKSVNIELMLDPPSTSKEQEEPTLDQVPDTTDEVPEVEDSLGLLAESSRVVEDDEEAEEDEDGDGEGDDDEDFDQDDESSNQMTAEHSEDSNAQLDKEDGQTDKVEKTPTPEREKELNFAVVPATSNEGGDMETQIAEDSPEVQQTIATEASEKEPKEELLPEITDAQTTISDQETQAATNSILKELLEKEATVPAVRSGSLSTGVVDVEGSSSEDDIQEVNKTNATKEIASVDVKEESKPLSVDIKYEAESVQKKNTPETEEKVKLKPKTECAEVFSLDSDEEDAPVIAGEITIADKPQGNKCINPLCGGGARARCAAADSAARGCYGAHNKRSCKVCLACAEAAAERSQGLMKCIKDFTPLLKMDLRKVSSETVEISDSDSDDGDVEMPTDAIGENGVKFLEDNLADVLNETWIKYKLDERLTDAQSELNDELNKLEAESKEIDTMLNECQVATDLLRNQLYATFEPERRELTAISIIDTPLEKYSYSETKGATTDRSLKRRTTTASDQPAKRLAIPLGYTPNDADESKSTNADGGNDEDKDISVVKLSAEAAPSDLPPPGEITRPPLRTGLSIFAMRNSFCTWAPAKIVEILPKNPAIGVTTCRVKFESKSNITTRILAARCLAYIDPADVRLTIGTRVIALSKENIKAGEPANNKSFYSGIVAEIPNPVNNYRYLIFFDHGYAQYVHHRDTRVVCECSNLVWEEVHPNSREFVKQYLLAYPERPMVRLHAGQNLKTEWNGKWWMTKVLQVDASLVEVSFEDNRTEWIYRGSTRLSPLFLELQAAERQRARPLPRSSQRRMNMPYVEYTRSEEQNKAETAATEQARVLQHNEQELRRQRAVARKSTAAPAPPAPPAPDAVTSRVVYYTPKNAVKPHKMAPHTCSPKCKRSDVLALQDLRTYNPLAKPLLSGWERQIVRFKGHKEVMYRAPCGRRVRSLRELHGYLRAVRSDMAVDLFDFSPSTHCLAEFVLNKCLVGKKDLSHGKENVPVPCVNYYDESLPEFCSYNTERTPTAGVPLNIDPEFLCGCDCTDDCEDKTKCACWKMTLEGARTIGLDDNVGYQYRRLPEPLPSGIYECNSRCKCKQTCLNRVAQHPLQLKLQVFKTLNRGWGIRALNDVPKGAFLCVYAGNLLTDATANLDGLNEGDEYLAELDYIEVVEQMKEGYEEDIPEEDKKLDRKSSKSSEEEEESSEEEATNTNEDKEDDDFQPGFIGHGLTEFSKRLRKRDRTKKKDAEKEKAKEVDKGMEDNGCITISDDEEAKEPSQFMAQAAIGANEFVPKYRSVRSLFGKDEACYIMDAKVQGNIGRYLNHSCTPNVFVQNVFVDTHDPRFPWVAFFALSHIRAGTELTWNYNYDVGSVPGKMLYCYCGAPNCRGRLL